MTATEYRGLPWHDQRMYAELLAEELTAEAEERGERMESTDAAGDLTGSPFRVQQVSA